jgi:hypothetical protein
MPDLEPGPATRLPERNKRGGLHYAVTDEGVELPVIDLTHPAFDAVPSLSEQERAVEEYLEMLARQARVPAALRGGLYWLMGLGSPIMRAVRGASSGYLSGLHTYLVKLGPENLGDAYATRLDRAVVRSLPSLSARLRLRNAVQLTVEALDPLLAAWPGRPLHFVNVAGGPAMDSINALLVLQRDRPHLLAGRAIHVHVLDIEASGASFGRRALAALSGTRAPLDGLQVGFEHERYDWTRSESLPALTAGWNLADAITACSSEGGLFEYGDDETVRANLAALRGVLPAHAWMTGSVTRDGRCNQAMRASGLRSPTHLRTREGFSALASSAGWQVDRVIDNWMTYDVRVRPA